MLSPMMHHDEWLQNMQYVQRGMCIHVQHALAFTNHQQLCVRWQILCLSTRPAFLSTVQSFVCWLQEVQSYV